MDNKQIAKHYLARAKERRQQKQVNEQLRYDCLIEHLYFREHLEHWRTVANELAMEDIGLEGAPKTERDKKDMKAKAQAHVARARQLIEDCKNDYVVHFTDYIQRQIRIAHKLTTELAAAAPNERGSTLDRLLDHYRSGFKHTDGRLSDDDPVLAKLFDTVLDLKDRKPAAPIVATAQNSLEDDAWN